MADWFETLAARRALSAESAALLQDRGFVVVPGPVPFERMGSFTTAYTAAMSSASGAEVRVGSTSTRLSDFVNRGPEFDAVYTFAPLLDACCRVIGQPFKLSSLHARTLRPGTDAQELHVDVATDSSDWPLLGFVLMVDEFRPDNGATRFVPGSHREMRAPRGSLAELRADRVDQVQACGPPGSLLMFNGSVWHGHAANRSDAPRRSLQGAFIPRRGRSATDFAARMLPATRARLSPLARHLLSAW